jgi:hypothetical protein
MDRRFRHCFFLILSSFLVSYAQDAEEDSFYREDQFYFGVSYLVNESKAVSFNQEGLSGQFSLGFIRDFPLHRSGRLALGLGLGYERLSLRNNIRWNLEEAQPEFSYAQNPQPFSFQSLSLPVELRWRSSSLTKYAFWRVYSGMKWNRNWALKSEQQQLLSEWIPSAYLSVGYNTWNLQLAYTLKPLFVQSIVMEDEANIRLLSLGLVFYFF